MKKIIIACDSYKGCLSSREVNEAIASGVKEWNADDASPEIITLEMSDGGEGMLDGGIGMLKAMGDDWKKIRQECSFVLASDVTNPLCGENGAAHVFAPQKGADAKMVQMLDDRARKFAEVSAKHFGYDRSMASGAGAAGGLGYAFLQYFNAEARPGAELLLDEIGFDALIQDADLVITGEGRSDRQTLMGKLPQRILEHGANQKNWLVSGGVSDRQVMLDAGFDRVIQITPDSMPLEEAMKPNVARNNIIKAIRRQFAL